jgi:acetyl-CoA acyltransferase
MGPVRRLSAGLVVDMDPVEMHALAAQVLSNLEDLLCLSGRSGRVSRTGWRGRPDRLNVMDRSDRTRSRDCGRILTTLVNDLRRRDAQFGLMTVCAACGMGHAMVVERRG